MDPKRRALLTAGAAVAAAAAVPRLLAQQTSQPGTQKFYEKGPFAFATRRPGRASRSCCSPAAD